jgi:hypothetical protein
VLDLGLARQEDERCFCSRAGGLHPGVRFAFEGAQGGGELVVTFDVMAGDVVVQGPRHAGALFKD